MTIRIANPRPLVVAIGPRATAQIEDGPLGLDVVDVASVDRRGTADSLGERPIIVCLFDGRDEAWWAEAARVARVARLQSDLPLLFLCCDPRPPSDGRRAMLRRLAVHLDACVIDASNSGLVRTAALSLTGLCVPGVVGFDPADFATVMKPPSVGFVAFGDIRAVLEDPGVSYALVSIRGGADATLEDIEAVSTFVTRVAPDAGILMSAVFEAAGTSHRIEVGVIAVTRAQR